MNYSSSNQENDFNKIMIDVTTRCNLQCPVCYRAKDSQEDLPVSLLKDLARKYRGKIISLCGGEPTVRQDLPEIIRLFSKRNTVFLVTNGVRLVDYRYLKNLKSQGLRYVSFSFNGFSDQVYNKINGQDLLSLKLKALENLKTAGIKTILSVLIVKGVNEKQIGGILKYCLENRSFINELRIRTMVPISKYLSVEKYTVEDLLGIVCQEASVNPKDVLAELEIKKRVNSLFGKEIFIQRACSLDFHLKRNGRHFLPVAQSLRCRPIGKNKISGILLLLELWQVYGVKMLAEGFLKANLKDERKPWVHNRNIFKIGLRSWPTGEEFNPAESKKCQTGYYLDAGVLPFCYANLLKDKNNSKVLPESL